MRAFVPFSLAILTNLALSSTAPADDAPLLNEPILPPPYAARGLDDEGRLGEALPLYAARAAQTATQADRLHHGGALLRALRVAEAREVFDGLVAEEGSIEHGGGTRARTAAACASAALAAGAPLVAADYAHAAVSAGPHDTALRLLLVRALAAAGDVAGARALLKELAEQAGAWSDGPRIELARWQLATGDVRSAGALLARPPPESVAQMFHDSVRAQRLLARADWAKAAGLLRAAERKVPRGLDDERVGQTWRNVQRELRWVRLRRAVALWHDGDRDEAVAEAEKARRSDEAYVRAAATILLAAGELAAQRRGDALARLTALAGHDYRFSAPVDRLAAALAAGTDPFLPIGALRAEMAAQDHSAEPVTAPLLDAFADAFAQAARSSGPPAAGPLAAAR